MKSTEGLVIKPQKYEAKVVYWKDKNLEEYQNKLKKKYTRRINRPIKTWFKDLLGLDEEIERKPPKYVKRCNRGLSLAFAPELPPSHTIPLLKLNLYIT